MNTQHRKTKEEYDKGRNRTNSTNMNRRGYKTSGIRMNNLCGRTKRLRMNNQCSIDKTAYVNNQLDNNNPYHMNNALCYTNAIRMIPLFDLPRPTGGRRLLGGEIDLMGGPTPRSNLDGQLKVVYTSFQTGRRFEDRQQKGRCPMFLKVKFTPIERINNPKDPLGFIPDPGSWIVGDVAEVKFTPVVVYDQDELSLPPESDVVKIFSSRMHLKAGPNDPVKVNLAQLTVTLKDGNVVFVYFDDEAYLCGDNGKTLEKFSARVSLQDLS